MDYATGGDPAFQQPFDEDELASAEPSTELTGTSDDGDAWRQEVAARLERYRSRRKPRAPRYPSLFLPFDSPEGRARQSVAAEPITPAPAQTHATDSWQADEQAREAPRDVEVPVAITEIDEPANLIEFPRSAAIPVFRRPELADPILDRPRIVEAPEIVPPPPALGGILMEPDLSRKSERWPAAEVPISSSTIAQRVGAGVIDSLVLGAALAAFAAVFVRLNPELPPLTLLAGSLAAVGVLLWCVYQYFFIVYTGSTPGVRVLKLRLAGFDGSAVHRKQRRWRVLASFLSMFSLGLGYFWSLLDENGLCWHDRITRTHLQTQNFRQ